MKSRKKWSIPIALAVVLMLAAVVGLAGIVQAHNTDSRTFSTDGNNGKTEVIGSIDHAEIVAKVAGVGNEVFSCAVKITDPTDAAKFVDSKKFKAAQNADKTKCVLSADDNLLDKGGKIGDTHNIVVEIKDDNSLIHKVSVTINVTDAVSSLVVTPDSVAKIVEYKTKKNAEVGRVTVTYADGTAPAGEDITYLVDDEDFKGFVAKVDTIEVNEGVIRADADLNTLKVYNLTITAEIDNTDGTPDLKGTAKVTYTVAKLDPITITVSDLGIRSDAAMDTEVGTVEVTEVPIEEDKSGTSISGESIDFILSGATDAFAIDAGTDDEDNVVGVITTARMLTAADVGTHEMTVTAHGVAPTRTAQAPFNILVTAGRAVPDPMAAPPYDVSFAEDDKGEADLISAASKQENNLAANVSNHASSFKYELVPVSTVFELSKKGVLKFRAAVAKSAEGMTPARKDEPTTSNIDESKPAVYKYTRPLGDGGKFFDDKGKLQTTVEFNEPSFPDVYYELDVKVTNGTSSSATFKVLVKLDVNEPATATGHPDTDANTEEPKFESSDHHNTSIIKMSDFVSLPESGDEPESDDKHAYTMSVHYNLYKKDKDEDGKDIDVFDGNEVTSPPFTIDPSTGVIRVIVPGAVRGIADDALTTTKNEEWNPEEDGWRVTVTVGDDFNQDEDTLADEDEIDDTIVFTLNYEAVAIGAANKSFMVAENTDAGTVVGSLADLIDAADDYLIFSATGNANNDFAIAEDGDVTVVNPRNYEAAGAVNNVALIVNALNADGFVVGTIIASIEIVNVNEAPGFNPTAVTFMVDENSENNSVVGTVAAMDPDGAHGAWGQGTVRYAIDSGTVPFKIDNPATGEITVKGDNSLNFEDIEEYTFIVTATDGGGMSAGLSVTVEVDDGNEAPEFVSAVLYLDTDPPTTKTVTISDGTSDGKVFDVIEDDKDENPSDRDLATYTIVDPDGDTHLKFSFKDSDHSKIFEIKKVVGESQGKLSVKAGLLDHETAPNTYNLEINVCDGNADNQKCDEIEVTINVTGLNDERPVFNSGARSDESVVENTQRGGRIGDYSATDADAGDTITYEVKGTHGKSFQISDKGILMTLEALDADREVPCGTTGCKVEVHASDGKNVTEMTVTITVDDVVDSISTFDLSKANPVPGVTMGKPMTALGDAKSGSLAVPESPADLPATNGNAPMNFVGTQWANWGTVLRIAVTAESPEKGCGGGNECVEITVASDSAGETLVLKAYRSTEKDYLFIAAVMPVSGDDDMESTYDVALAEFKARTGKEEKDFQHAPVYAHTDGTVARLEVDEEDEITIEFGNLRGTIDIENEKPEFNNFAPEHESAFDDGDVDYTFTVTDPVSGIPEPEDLPDPDVDDDYMPVVAVISVDQCKIIELDSDGERTVPKGYSAASNVHGGANLYCRSQPEIRQIVDDRDFDEIDDGFEVDTKIVLPENEKKYVTFIVCDAAGNCAMYTPDDNEPDEALAEITIDTNVPELVEARTGIKWDATDSEYDDDRSFIQLLFKDLTALNPDTIEVDDFVVEGHTIKDVHWYDVSDTDDDTAWGDDDESTKLSRFAIGGKPNSRKHPLRQSIRNAVFIELEDELAADETPDVTVVPNGIEDSAGNEQDDGDVEADDWIAPSFTVVSIVSPRTPEGSSNVLAGDGDEVVVTLTADERIQQTRPNIEVTYVNAPAGCVNADNRTEKNPYDRGEIITGVNGCGGSATGGKLGTDFEKVSNTEWIVTIDEPGDTGYYNFYVFANDRSPQGNKGSEGIAKDDIVGDFFERDGDVNSDDAHYFQGDINLANPGVRVSGMQIQDTEPTVEFKTPLFVELDFTRPYIADCDDDVDDDVRDADCLAESDEYAKDSFDSVTVTSFVLNGVDMTDSVKTTDDETFLVSIVSIGIGDHEIEVQAMDQAGNTLDKSLSIEFEVEERDPFSRRLNPGWNLVSLPGEPADSDISVVFGSNVEVRTVYTYDPIIPGGWMVAVRETLDSDWQGDLMDITARRGYWVLSDAIQDWEVSIPRLAGGAVGSGTPIQPPVIGLYAGWNLIPVVDVRGGALDDGKSISATAYLNSLDDGLDLARVLGFNTITNTWTTVLDPDDTSDDAGELRIGSGYWVFVREAASLVPGGIAQ